MRGPRAVSRSEFVGVQGVLVAFALILELVAQQGLLRAHGGETDLVVVLVPVLPQSMETVLLSVGLGGADAPDDARRDGQGGHNGRWKKKTDAR